MTSRARRRIAMMTTVGCLLGIGPLAASAEEFPGPQAKAPSIVVAQSTPKAKKETKAKPEKVHKIAIQVAENNPALMNLALNNAGNIISHYKKAGEKVIVEIVTFGPGLHMLREDTAHASVKQRVQQTALETPEIAFYACANTQANMSKQEGKEVKVITEAKITPSGVVRLAELQGQGYAYIRP
jgi:intracellular sulfur oxidation DsrE/DsrF family protein